MNQSNQTNQSIKRLFTIATSNKLKARSKCVHAAEKSIKIKNVKKKILHGKLYTYPRFRNEVQAT